MCDLSRCQLLTDGWDDGDGASVAGSALQAAKKFLRRRPLLCSSYKIYPTSAGGILFEFECNGWDLSLEFLVGGSVEMFGIEVSGRGELLPKHFDGVDEVFIAEFDFQVGRDGS